MDFKMKHSESAFKFDFNAKSKAEAAVEEDLKKELAEGSRSISRWHWAMLMDRSRNDPYDQAIAKAAKKATTVLDIGSGTGLLSMLCGRACLPVRMPRQAYSVSRPL